MPATAATQRGTSLATGYASAGPFDELLAGSREPAPHWGPVLACLEAIGAGEPLNPEVIDQLPCLEALSHEQRLERVERINMRVRETGIAHDLFADPARSVQPWRLDLMPLVLPPAEWARIEMAVIQRARLIEMLLADIYGPQRLMKRGLVPPNLVFADSSFLRAVHGLSPTAARLQFLAVDLARGPDGSWRIVDTHTETPAGIGYALANRTVLTHVCGDIFSASKALRLAPYFQRMQDALASRVNRADPSFALLTPGPRHNDFFSHAYLARYLGMLLMESEDLRVEDGRVFLKTLDGLQPIDAIVRCVAGSACDALELDPSGFLGPVGLVQAVRRQPDVIRYRDHLTWGYVDQAYVARGQGRSLDALELFRKAVAQQELVIESSPKRRETQNNLATNYVDIGLLELDQGRAAEATIAFAPLNDLGVAGDHRHAGLARRPAHRLGDPLEVGQREALLEDEARAQVERRGAQHGHVVERAVHGQAADVAAGEEQRRDHVAVGGHHQAVAGGHRQQRSVVALEQVFVVEGGREQLLDQLRRGAAAGAVVHVDAAVLEVDRADVVGLGHVHAATTGMSRNRP